MIKGKNAGRIILFLGLAVVLLLGSLVCSTDTPPVPPDAKKVPKVDTLHGEIRADDYYWLREKDSPDVVAYLEAENDYVDAVTADIKDFEDDIYDEMLSRIKETDMDVPYKLDDYYYYTRTEEGKEYTIYCRKKGSLEAEEEIYYDHNLTAANHEYCDLGIINVSPNHNLLAYSIDTLGNEKYTVFFKNLTTGEQLDDYISDISRLVWANDNKTVFYNIRSEVDNRPYKMFRHVIGSSQEEDELVFHEPDDMFWMGIGKTKSKDFILMGLGSHSTSEYWYLDADNPMGEFKKMATRKNGVEYYPSHHGDKFYITTNEDAQNFKIVTAPVSDPSKKNWKEYIPHREEVMIEDLGVYKNHLVVYERENGLSNLRIIDLKSGDEHYVEFPEPVYGLGGGANVDFNTNLLRFSYYSMVTPRSIYDYNMDTKERELLKQQEVLGGYDKTQYETKRIYAEGHDGVMIPISLVYKKDLMKKDGNNPCYLYVYGAYGNSLEPYFSTTRFTLMNRGFVFCYGHVRGGSEMGRKWYDDGKLNKKMNTFLDVISCAEHLVEENYTASDKLVLGGGSAGGTTVGAAMNMRPDLFEIVVAEVPFVDVINTLLDPTIPLTVIEWDELGNPQEEEYYKYIKKYSPYDNVIAQDYPTLLVMTSYNDPRVAYWEPAKWVAKMRDMKTDENLVLLKTNMEAGHGGSSGRYQRIRELAFEYAFILDHLGIHE